jgi:large subunit ribosomal protein L33
MRVIVSLVCEECKSKNYTTTKNKRRTTTKFRFRKYCPKCGKHTWHKEGKA